MPFNFRVSWIQLFISLGVVCYYVYSAITISAQGQLNDELIKNLTAQAVIIMVLLQVVIIAITAILNVKEADRGDDERDKLFKLYGDQAGYFVFGALAAIVMIWIWSGRLDRVATFEHLSDAANILFLIFVSFLISEVAKYSRQLWLYYRG